METETGPYIAWRNAFDHNFLGLFSVTNKNDLLDLIANDELGSDNIIIELKNPENGIEGWIWLLTACVDLAAICNIDCVAEPSLEVRKIVVYLLHLLSQQRFLIPSLLKLVILLGSSVSSRLTQSAFLLLNLGLAGLDVVFDCFETLMGVSFLHEQLRLVLCCFPVCFRCFGDALFIESSVLLQFFLRLTALFELLFGQPELFCRALTILLLFDDCLGPSHEVLFVFGE
ncbi:hypothetical protein HG531_010555 [Fusarium graminearum]|nr:hypothetical protein HG531_010555 [Fusarium graminearum]